MRRMRIAAVAVAALALVLPPALLSGAKAATEPDITPINGVFRLEGHGYGHGRGMSQWGAYGAATAGLSYSQILAFYYPGTTLTATTDPMMRVLVSADNDNSTKVLPVSGLSVCSSSGHRTLLSTSSSISVWRLVRVSGQI